MPYRKLEPVPCIDRRPCHHRGKDGICSILTEPYNEDGACGFCREKPDERVAATGTKSAGQIIDQYLKLMPKERREPSCVFYSGAARKFCRATSNKSCKGCAFYSPNKAARTDALAKLLIDAEEDKRRLRNELRAATDRLKHQERHARIGRAVERFRKERGHGNG